MKTPVLLVSNFLSGSGGSRGVCEELAERLATAGTPVLTTSSKSAKMPRLFDMLTTIWRKRRHYAVAQVDVYSGPAFLWAEAACAALRWRKKPYLLTLHGGNLPQFSKRHPARVRRLLNSARIVTTPSRYLHQAMSPFRNELLILPNALDLSRYTFRLREQIDPSLVWLRALHRTYNPTLAPKVLELLIQTLPLARLTMIGPDKGDGSREAVLKTAAQLQLTDRISLPGGVAKTEVPAWLNRGDIFLNTTHVDNAPVSVLEAMASGLCVVSTNVGGLPWLLNDGEDALLVPPDNASAMAGAVRRLLNDPALARRLSQSGRLKAEQHDWSVVLPKWQRLFEQVAPRFEPDWRKAVVTPAR